MRRFVLDRLADESGVSGTGRVACGVEMPSGRVVMEWTREYRSIGIYGSVSDLEAVHGHGGKTILRWLDSVDTGQVPW